MVLSAVLIAGSCVSLVNDSDSALAYLSYLLASVALIVLIYLTAILIRRTRKQVINLARKNEFTRQFVENWSFRTFIFTIFGFIVNCIYAVFQLIMGVKASSSWFIVLAIYYIVLSVMRGIIVFGFHRGKTKRENEIKRYVIYLFCGICFLVLAVALIIAIVFMVRDNHVLSSYSGIMIYAAAAFTFYKLTVAIISFVKSKKQSNYAVKAVKNIGVVEACFSLLSLQSAMFLAFGASTNHAKFDAISGGIVTAITLVLGIIMIISAIVHLKNISKTE